MIKEITTLSAWSDFKDSWDKHLQECASATPYQSFAYYWHSWKNMDIEGCLNIILIYRQVDRKLLAICPCYIDKKGTLRMINDIHTDFCSFLVRTEVEKDYHFYSEFADYIKKNSRIKGFMFDNLDERNSLSSILLYFFPGALVRLSNKYSYTIVPAMKECDKTLIDSLPHLSTKDRSNLKKIQKGFSELKYAVLNISNTKFEATGVKEIVEYMSKSGLRTDAYFSESFISFIRELYNDGLISVALTSKCAEPVAANICINRGHDFFNWLAVYKDGKMTTTNLLQTIQFIYENGGGILNFARGIYEYKVRNFRPEIYNLYRIEYSKKKLGQICNLLSVYKYYAKCVLRPLIRK